MVQARLALTMLLLASPAGAECRLLDGWETVVGSASVTPDCAGLIVSSDGSATAFSFGSVARRDEVQVPFEVSVTWRRLGPEGRRPLELGLVGVTLMLNDESWGMWTDQARWVAEGGWRPLPGYRVHDEHRVTARQSAREVVVLIDGRPAIRYPFAAPRRSGRVGLGFKGSRSYRSQALFRDVVVRALDR